MFSVMPISRYTVLKNVLNFLISLSMEYNSTIYHVHVMILIIITESEESFRCIISKGFCNWKNAIESMNRLCHKEAVEVIVYITSYSS